MSLFGDDIAPTKQTKSSALFEDEASKPGAGLFESDGTPGAISQSPWDFPTPRKAARRDAVKSLLPDATVPQQYLDFVDALLARGATANGNITTEASTNLIRESGLNSDEQHKIIALVSSGTEGLSRSEANVILALIALAQAGEDISLDAVDERKQSLPTPSLPRLELVKTAASTLKEVDDNSHAQMRDPPKPAVGALDSDPWGAPEMHKGHDHPVQNGAANGPPSSPSRTTSTFTTAISGPRTTPYGSVNRRPSALGPDTNGWANDDALAANPAQIGFNTQPTGARNTQAKMIKPSRPITAGGVQEQITITSLDGKEGMFLFQHRNYEVASIRRNTKVVRRYSDFVWLLDCLHKKYPFRQLPLLPPKRVAINGNHIAADTLFIEKRRRGLVRFVNALIRHPVLAQEQLVVMFLTVPTELSVWRKQAQVSAQEEFAGKTLPAGLEDSLPSSLNDTFDKVRLGVRQSSDHYIHMCTMVEKLAKYNTVLSNEYTRLGATLTSLMETTTETYATDSNDVPLLNEGLSANARHLGAHASLLDAECTAWEGGLLEDIKVQRDCLVSVRDMFDRRDRLVKDNIPQLERRILSNENKLVAIRNKPEGQVKPGEAVKVEDAIIKDKQSIVDQHARGVFIKECIRDELIYFNTSLYHISRLHQDWSQERVKYAELAADNWRRLSEEIEAMPVEA